MSQAPQEKYLGVLVLSLGFGQNSYMERPRTKEGPRRLIDGVLGYLWFLGNDLEHRKQSAAEEIANYSETHPGYVRYLEREHEHYLGQLREEYQKAAKMIYEILPKQMVVTGELYRRGEEEEGEPIDMEGASLLLRGVVFLQNESDGMPPRDMLVVLSDSEHDYCAPYSKLAWREDSPGETPKRT